MLSIASHIPSALGSPLEGVVPGKSVFLWKEELFHTVPPCGCWCVQHDSFFQTATTLLTCSALPVAPRMNFQLVLMMSCQILRSEIMIILLCQYNQEPRLPIWLIRGSTESGNKCKDSGLHTSVGSVGGFYWLGPSSSKTSQMALCISLDLWVLFISAFQLIVNLHLITLTHRTWRQWEYRVEWEHYTHCYHQQLPSRLLLKLFW